MKRVALLITLMLVPALSYAHTDFYVRPDGGTRFTNAKDTPKGQCNGKHDAAYRGSGVNQPCAFKEVAYLEFDGTYVYAPKPVFQGGDVVHIAAGQYRVGYNGPTDKSYVGLAVAGDPFGTAISIPGGTASEPTTFIGAGVDKTQIYGGYGLGAIFSVNSANVVI